MGSKWQPLVTRLQDIESLTIGELLEKTAQRAPQSTAIKYVGEASTEVMTYGELNRNADALAASLSHLGVKKGDRVAVDLPNLPEFIISYYAIHKLGAIMVPVNPRYRTEELSFILNNSAAETLIVARRWGEFDYLEMLGRIRKDLRYLKRVVVVRGLPEEGMYSFDGLVKEGWAKSYPKPKIDSKDDVAVVLYTSGTTGTPKGAMLTHHNILWQTPATRLAEGGNPERGRTAMFHQPLYHVGGMALIPYETNNESVMLVLDRLDVELWLSLIEKEKVQNFTGVPALFIMVLNHPNFNKYDLSSLRVGGAGGDRFGGELLRRIKKEMGYDITSLWGMTELGGLGTTTVPTDNEERRAETIGRAPTELGMEARIVDDDKKEVPRGEIGEIAVRGPCVTKGYWNNPEETSIALDNEGWLYTGDLGIMDEEGYIRIVDRKKEMYIRGGYNVYPTEVESLLREHPKVLDCAIIGVPDEVMGEIGCACVIPRPGEMVTLEELRGFLKGRIASFKHPERLLIMSDLPRFPTTKVRKRDLKQQVMDLLK